MKTYIIMKRSCTAICVGEYLPHLVVFSLKDAKRITEELNSKAVLNQYSYQSVKNNHQQKAKL